MIEREWWWSPWIFSCLISLCTTREVLSIDNHPSSQFRYHALSCLNFYKSKTSRIKFSVELILDFSITENMNVWDLPKLSPSCPQVVPKLSSSCPQVVLKLSPSFTQVLQESVKDIRWFSANSQKFLWRSYQDLPCQEIAYGLIHFKLVTKIKPFFSHLFII